MKITLYAKKSDAYAQMERVLTDLRLPYELRFKGECPEIGQHIVVTASPVLIIDGRCTFVSPQFAPEAFKVLVQSCTEDIQVATDSGAKSEL